MVTPERKYIMDEAGKQRTRSAHPLERGLRLSDRKGTPNGFPRVQARKTLTET